MNLYKLSILISFSFLTLISNASQLEARKLCIKKTVSSCMERCQKTKRIQCATACPEIAHNQCRQAGE